MNLSEALDAALPEIPKARLARIHPPRLDPDLVVREDTLDGAPIIGVMQRGKGNYFRFPPIQWKLALLFDGVRSYEEIADLFAQETGSSLSPADVRLFSQNMDESDFWYKTAQEKNLALSEKLRAQRSRRAKRTSKINFAHISFSAWDPDRYLGWLDRAVGGFIYNPWSILILVLLLFFQAAVYVEKWSTMAPDMVLYYTFSHKTLYDLAEFWLLFLFLGFFHESAHGLTCKHFGGQVHSMGLMFLYLAPCFFVDVTEGWISATRIQRMATIVAGIWVELTICSFAMIIWLNTQSGQWLHDFSYQVILLTGIAVIVINLNPLIKLDGYYLLTEFIGIPDLKESSTAFLSASFQARVLRLPVDVPVIPRRRLVLFSIYAFVSGLYSYLLLFAVVRFTYNVAYNWLAEFALLPAGALAFGVFRSRLRSLRDVGTRFSAEHFRTRVRWRLFYLPMAIVLLLLIFVPVWRDREDAMFVIEPSHSSTLHAAARGHVREVLVQEGERVTAGQVLLRILSPAIASMRATATAEGNAARYKAFAAQVSGQGIGSAASSQEEAAQAGGIVDSVQSALTMTSPASGVVMTADPASLLNQDVASGQSLLTIAEEGPRVARVYVPASALDRIPAAADVVLAPPGRFEHIRLRLGKMEGGAVSLPPGLIASQDYKGITLPTYYSALTAVPAAGGTLPLGTAGEAKIFGQRRSLFQRCVSIVANLVRAHVW